ncbi:MAG TPA: DNA polymerase III subunit chi [Burkholderiaceae bacterium]
MTEITFHFNVPDRAGYACRLLRKAARAGALLVVTAPAAELAGFDRLLWTFDPTEFLPHLLQRRGTAVPPHLRTTPIWLSEEPLDAMHHQVLVNLGREVPQGFESFERVIEIVSADADDRQAARLRWKHYAVRGYEIQKHEVAA